MTLPEYNKRIDGVVKDLQSGAHAVVMVSLALDAMALIKQRVQETGVNAEGQKYKPYSTKDMLVGKTSFVQKAAADKFFSKTNRKKVDWVTLGGSRYSQMLSESAGMGSNLVRLAVLKGGYAELRKLQGRQVDHFDMSVTGNTWKDINIISKQAEHEKGVAVIGARNEQYKKILSGNTKRRGDILDLSAKEIETLKKDYNLGVLQIFKNNGL